MTEQLSMHTCRKTGLSVLTPDSPRNPHCPWFTGVHCPWLAGMATSFPFRPLSAPPDALLCHHGSQSESCFAVFYEYPLFCLDFLGSSVSKESDCSTGDPVSITGSGKIRWRRKWQTTPASLPGKSLGQRSLVGCSPWVAESDMTE